MATPPYDRPTIIEKVRIFMRDQAAFNALLFGEETDDDTIDLCIDMTLDDFMWTTPQIGGYTLDNFPSFYLLIIGTVINVLRSAGILQSRNNLNYSDGGITVASSDKTPLYQSWIDRFYRDYEEKKKKLKMQLNAQKAYGNRWSEYYFMQYGNYGLFGGI